MFSAIGERGGLIEFFAARGIAKDQAAQCLAKSETASSCSRHAEGDRYLQRDRHADLHRQRQECRGCDLGRARTDPEAGRRASIGRN
jgi:hypothetical protein